MFDHTRILVVEDDAASQEMLVRRLASRGLEVTALESGEGCLEYLETHTADLVLLDVNLPGLSGLEVLNRLRERWAYDALPVILVTALGESEDIIRGLEAGANDYVVKPVNLPVLLARMRVSLKIRRGAQLLVEAERQRAMLETLARTCDQLSQPMTAIVCMLGALIRQPPDDPAEVRDELTQVLTWMNDVSNLLHRLRSVGYEHSVPYQERMQMLGSGGSPRQG